MNLQVLQHSIYLLILTQKARKDVRLGYLSFYEGFIFRVSFLQLQVISELRQWDLPCTGISRSVYW